MDKKNKVPYPNSILIHTIEMDLGTLEILN